MKYLKMFINWIKGLFSKTTKEEQTTLKVDKKLTIIEKKRLAYENAKTPKQKRDAYLSLKGFTIPKKRKEQPIRTLIISSYKANVLKFIELKRKGLIHIKSYRNKQGIPFYDLIKSSGEQLNQAKKEA